MMEVHAHLADVRGEIEKMDASRAPFSDGAKQQRYCAIETRPKPAMGHDEARLRSCSVRASW
jgi:hypothetical protein